MPRGGGGRVRGKWEGCRGDGRKEVIEGEREREGRIGKT